MLDDIAPGWLWAIGGIVLLALEMVAPGVFLFWIGIAAIVTGLFALLFPIGIAGQLGLFAIYALLAVFAGRRFYAVKGDSQVDARLNDRTAQLIGRRVLVVQPVDEDGGRVRVGDSEWSARGGPAQPGDKVRITGVEGNCLIVEFERQLPAS
ncbi:NfeD family protein [Sphingomonas sabuli]|uniref:NfeD family protein n=1 Tax=Sphingomonas sabuli TaxID=2764186 RepID=A0A7G9L4Q4_9SPHN|nr:NfeD family protein [Sphingomonas sabuli]QNM83603.1 NfeD family protein [Sphingomonas sabuli]